MKLLQLFKPREVTPQPMADLLESHLQAMAQRNAERIQALKQNMGKKYVLHPENAPQKGDYGPGPGKQH